VAARWIVLIATAIGVFLVGITRPLHDWDTIGYVAAAYQMDGYRDRELLNRTFQDIKADVSNDTFKILTEGEGQVERHYRQTVYSDPKALSQQIPFYSIRIVYIELIRLFGRIWPSYSMSSYLISATFAALSVAVLSRIIFLTGVHFAFLPLVALAGGVSELARISSPDSMALFFAIFCLLTLLRGSILCYALAAILPIIRTDMVVLSIIFMSLDILYRRRIIAVVVILLSVVLYMWVNKVSGNYGWIALFNVSTSGATPYPAALRPSSDWRAYVRPYFFAVYDFVSSGQFIAYFLSTYLLLSRSRAWVLFGGRRAMRAMLDPVNMRVATLYMAPVLYSLCHVLLFPHFESRYFVFGVTILLVLALSRERLRGSVRGESAGIGDGRPALNWSAAN
jgi:hypothetical protein